MMARGESGRVVLEVDPDLKNELYIELARQRLTLKAWFLAVAQQFIDEKKQPALFDTNDRSIPKSPAPKRMPKKSP